MKNRELHYRYAISYFLIALILLVALAYYDVPNLVDKLSFALTLSSLLLAILAIFYTIISANKQDSQFTKIIEATSKLGGSVEDINRAASSIAKLTRDVPQHFDSISTKIDEIQSSYSVLTESEKNESFQPNTNIGPDNTDLVKIIPKLHFNGMAVLYYFVESAMRDSPIDFKDIEDFEIASVDYTIGFLNGFEATGLIDFKLHKKSIIPTHCDDYLHDNLRQHLDRVVKVINEKSSNELASALSWVDAKFS